MSLFDDPDFADFGTGGSTSTGGFEGLQGVLKTVTGAANTFFGLKTQVAQAKRQGQLDRLQLDREFELEKLRLSRLDDINSGQVFDRDLNRLDGVNGPGAPVVVNAGGGGIDMKTLAIFGGFLFLLMKAV